VPLSRPRRDRFRAALQVIAFCKRNTRQGIQDFLLRLFILFILSIHVNNRPHSKLCINTQAEQRPPSPYAIDVKIGDVMHQSKDVQEPHNHHNDDNRIQDRLNGTRHRNEGVDEPEKNAHHNQGK
jgi:hypothetical protein